MAAPLSPRSTNLPARPEHKAKKEQLEVKAAALRTLQREKDHPLPPPAVVNEPNGPNGEKGEEYVVGRYLGKGGFAICYEGETKADKKKYALKIVKTAMPQAKLAEKFKTELQIHSKMQHPNIVEFHRAFTFGECTFVVLELCKNGSLMEMVKARKFLSEPEVRRYVIQMCGAIKYLHGKNVIHRDLKMGNIFLDENMNVKIGDFGLAALLLSQSEYSLNRRRTLCGTPNYIAPEVLAKSWKGHDHKVDLWSLGIIIYAMLTGFPPFQSKTQEEIYRKVKARSYLWPSAEACTNEISQQAKDLVASLLVEAEERPDPDDIVGHSFFTSGIIAGPLTPLAKQTRPSFEEWSPQTGISEDTWRKRQWVKECSKCGVGKIDGIHFPPVGEESNKSTYKECLLEEKAGCLPIVPIPANVVYRRFSLSETLVAPIMGDSKRAMPGSYPESPLNQGPSTKSSSSTASQPVKQVALVNGHVQVQPAPKRQEYRSHAAQLRERDQPVKPRVQEPRKVILQAIPEKKAPAPKTEDPTQASSGTMRGKPVRLNSKGDCSKQALERPIITRITRSRTAQGDMEKGPATKDTQPQPTITQSLPVRNSKTSGNVASAETKQGQLNLVRSSSTKSVNAEINTASKTSSAPPQPALARTSSTRNQRVASNGGDSAAPAPQSGLTRSSSAKSLQTTSNTEDPVSSASAKPGLTRSSSANSVKNAPSNGDLTSSRPGVKQRAASDPRQKKGVLSPVEETSEAEEDKARSSRPTSKTLATSKAPTASIDDVVKPRATSAESALFGPGHQTTYVPHTSAREVNVRLSVMLDSIRTALNRRQANRRAAPRRGTPLPLVIKWVDYSNKFGIGYTLNDGSMGCLLNAEGDAPSSGVYVRGEADAEIRSAKAKKQPPSLVTPLNGRPVRFYENTFDKGFRCLEVDEERYMVYLGGDDTKDDGKNNSRQGELSSFDNRKRRAILLWGRFANYMQDALAKTSTDETDAGEETAANTTSKSDRSAEGKKDHKQTPCVLFYERLGNVGVWGFDDGSFQFNFPDHTKLIFSEGATHIDFYHLPEASAWELCRSSTPTPTPNSNPTPPSNSNHSTILSRETLNKRGVLSYPMRDIVCKDLPLVAKANQLEQKLRFVSEVLRQWLSFGGLGRLDPDMIAGKNNKGEKVDRISWTGMAENLGDGKNGGNGAGNKALKPVWVSIGAMGGDFRVS